MEAVRGKVFLKEAGAKLFKSFYAGKGQILMFHRVLPLTEEPRIRNTGLEISPEKLEEVIEFFKQRNYSFISLEELPSYLLQDKGKFVVFTFDDGYVDNLTVAYPIFKEHAVPFTVYVTTDFPEGKAVMWWYLLEELLLGKEALQFWFKDKQFSYNFKNLTEKELVFAQIRRLIIDSDPEEKNNLFGELFIKNGIDLYQTTKEKALSWRQLAELAESKLVTIGAHTKTHPSLSTLSCEELKEEVIGSKLLLEEKLGKGIEHFAYPFGSRKEATEREFLLLKELGFKTATTTREGNTFKEHLKAMTALPRIYISSNTTEKHLQDFINGTFPFQRGVFQRVVTV